MHSVLASVNINRQYNCCDRFQQDKSGWPTIVSSKYLEPFALTSFALSLLLVFRTNSAYDRWWEARKAFGVMYNCTRVIARLVRALCFSFCFCFTCTWIPYQKIDVLFHLNVLVELTLGSDQVGVVAFGGRQCGA